MLAKANPILAAIEAAENNPPSLYAPTDQTLVEPAYPQAVDVKHTPPTCLGAGVLDPRDFAPGTREELITMPTAQRHLLHEHDIPNTVTGLKRACQKGFGPQFWTGRNGVLLTTYEALGRWIALERFHLFYKSKLVVGPLPPHDPERDYISLATIWPEAFGNGRTKTPSQ